MTDGWHEDAPIPACASWSREAALADGPPVVPEVESFANGHTNPWHSHGRACLIYPASGVVTVETAAGHWVVPPQRAVWLPAGVRHQTRMSGAVTFRGLIVDQVAIPDLPRRACVVGITPLLRELILHSCTSPAGMSLDGPEGRVIGVIVDQLQGIEVPALPLPIPQDPRLRRLVQAMIERPADNRSLEAWGREVGASGRTLARLFRTETALTFGAWRQHLRILEALRRLAGGEPVTSVALDVDSRARAPSSKCSSAPWARRRDASSRRRSKA